MYETIVLRTFVKIARKEESDIKLGLENKNDVQLFSIDDNSSDFFWKGATVERVVLRILEFVTTKD